MNKVFLLLAFAGVLGVASALKCYSCVSAIDDFCGVDFGKNTTYEVTCPADLDYCGKLTFLDKPTNSTSVTRGCTKKVKNCDQEDSTKKVECDFCKSDLCNTAAIPSSVSCLVYILPVALFLLTATSKV